jgi:hypothetical protein
MSNYIEEKLKHFREPFMIAEDGSSQTKLSNSGRVGFFFERAFGILPNSKRSPDFGNCELKTTQEGKRVSIGTMPEDEFDAIKRAQVHRFENSEPYRKMKNTLLIVYANLGGYPDVHYRMTGWGAMNLSTMNAQVKSVLQEDYEYICQIISTQCHTRDAVTDYLMRCGSIPGNYLTLSYKGQGRGGYNYPAWCFQAGFMKMITHA